MYSRDLKVMPSGASCLGTIKLKNLLDHFQDTAGLAVDDIEGTATELNARGYSWVLTRYEINFIGRLPVLDEKFRIKTFHDPSHGYNTLRVFHVESENGTPIIYAKTSWILLDLAAGRAVKAAAHLPEIITNDTPAIDSDFREIPDFDDSQIIKTVNKHVTFHDLDYNSHVNNAVYFGWIFDSTPVDLMNHELKYLCASFRSGARLGENITIQIAEPEKNLFAYKILRENIKKPSANFLCKWETKE
ncbi:MAG: hypothetical protein IJT21_07350 [Synergistaceae bacterium]|nr:hypothetical protein [Synergistaceae bacterium]